MRFPLPAILLAMVLAGTDIRAQLPVALLDHVYPPGGKAGATVEVTVGGADLDELGKAWVNHPGIIPEVRGGNRVSLQIGEDVPTGRYEFRVSGRFGISNSRLFQVGDLAEFIEKDDNRSVEKAMPISVNQLVNGRAQADVSDYYRFAGVAGQTIVIRCFSDRIDSSMDATLILRDAGGKEMKRSLDVHGRDPELVFPVEVDGDYVIEISDLLFQGGANHFYRLSLSDRPEVSYCLPAAGRAGTKQVFRLFGRNLPGGQPVAEAPGGLHWVEKEIEVPAEASHWPRSPGAAHVSGFFHHLEGANGRRSSPFFIGIASEKVIVEDAAAGKQKVEAPFDLSGRLFPSNDADTFEFDAKKGDAYRIEVISERLGQATDPLVLVQFVGAENGKEQIRTLKDADDGIKDVGGRRFPLGSRDSVHSFKAAEDGRYRLVISDQFNLGRPESIYRLIVRKSRPDFQLVARSERPEDDPKKQSFRWNAFVRKGGVEKYRVLALRQDGFDGEIKLTVKGLSKGLQALPAKIPKGGDGADVWVVAEPGVETWAGEIAIVGSSMIGDNSIEREALSGAMVWNVGDYNQNRIQIRAEGKLSLAVSGIEKPPVRLVPKEQKTWQTAMAGKLSIPLKVERGTDFKGNLTLKPTGLPGWKKPPSIALDGKKEEVAMTIDLTKGGGNEFKPGLYQITGKVTGKINYQANPEAKGRAEAAKKAADEEVVSVETAIKELEARRVALAATLEKQTKESTEAGLTGAALAERLKPSHDQMAGLEKEKASLDARLKEAGKKRTAAENQVKAATDRAKAKERLLTAYLHPLDVRIEAAPLAFIDLKSPGPSKAGSKVAIPVKIERRYGFAEAVEVVFHPPKDVKGFEVQALTLASDQTEGVLEVVIDAGLKPADYACALEAKLKWNNEALSLRQTLPLGVQAP